MVSGTPKNTFQQVSSMLQFFHYNKSCLNLKNLDCIFLMHILTLLINIHKYANEEIFANDHILVPLDLKFNLTPFEMILHEI